MDYNNNFYKKGSSIDINSKDGKIIDKSIGTPSSSAKDLNQDQLVDLVLKRLGHMYWPYRPTRYLAPASQGPYSCGICARPHKMEMCSSYMPSANNPSRQKWCQLCQWNYSHATPKCMRILRMPREREYGGQGQQMPARQEQPKPALGS